MTHAESPETTDESDANPPAPTPTPRVRYAAHYSLTEKLVYAEELRRSTMLGRSFNGSKANILYALEYAEATGLHPLTCMQGLFTIRGKAAANANLIAALVRMAGHRLRTTYDKTTRTATTTITRADDPEPHVIDWTLDDALQAGLIDSYDSETGTVTARDAKGEPTAWEKFTRMLLKARSLTECAREACQEALCGVIYTPEELGVDVDADGNPVEHGPSAEAPERERKQLDPQDGADLAYASADPAYVHKIMHGSTGAGILQCTVSAPDTGQTERLDVFLLRHAMRHTADRTVALGIFHTARESGLLQLPIPAGDESALETLGNYLLRAGKALSDGEQVPEPYAVTFAREAAAQAASGPSEGAEGAEGEDGGEHTLGELRAALGSGHPEVEDAASRILAGERYEGDFEAPPGDEALTDD